MKLELDVKFLQILKLSLEPKTHHTCWKSLIDVWERELTFPVVTEALNLTLPNFVILTTLYEILWEFLHVYHDEYQSWIDEKTCKGGNSGLGLRISSQDASEWLTGQRRLVESPNVEIMCLLLLCEFSRFWLRYTEIQKPIRLWRHRRGAVHVLA